MYKPTKTKPRPRFSHPSSMNGQPTEGITVFYRRYNGPLVYKENPCSPTNVGFIQHSKQASILITKMWPNYQQQIETHVLVANSGTYVQRQQGQSTHYHAPQSQDCGATYNPRSTSLTLHNESSRTWGQKSQGDNLYMMPIKGKLQFIIWESQFALKLSLRLYTL